MSDNRIGRAWFRKDRHRESGQGDLTLRRSSQPGRPAFDADNWTALDRLLTDPDDGT